MHQITDLQYVCQLDKTDRTSRIKTPKLIAGNSSTPHYLVEKVRKIYQ